MFEAINSTDIVLTVAVVVAALILVWALNFVFGRLLHAGKPQKVSIVKDVVRTGRAPVSILILLSGFYVAALLLPWTDAARSYLNQWPLVLIIALAIYAVVAMCVKALSLYEAKLKKQKSPGLAPRVLPWGRVLIILIAVLGLVLSGLAILGVDTSATVRWLGTYGTRILLIVVLALAAIIAVARAAPRIIETAMAHRAGESRSELKQRAETLSRVTVNVVQVLVILVAALTILTSLPLSPAWAWSAWPSASARRVWSKTSSPDCS